MGYLLDLEKTAVICWGGNNSSTNTVATDLPLLVHVHKLRHAHILRCERGFALYAI